MMMMMKLCGLLSDTYNDCMVFKNPWTLRDLEIPWKLVIFT